MSQPYYRVFNFSAGPCTLPVEVLEQAREDLLNYKGAGMSVMEMSHRSAQFEAILAEAEADCRKILEVPDNYRILFQQGGASFASTMLAKNFLPADGHADYVVTGTWGQKSYEYAKLEGDARLLYSGKDHKYSELPASVEASEGAAYLHFTSNETIQGVQFKEDPVWGAELICDMSSDIMSRAVAINRYAAIYAGAQKNMGPAGVTVVIVRDDMLEKVPQGLPQMLDYRAQAANGSMYNTPPCWSIYMCGLVYKHYLKTGGVAGAQERNEAKCKVLYDAIDGSAGYYRGHAAANCRSTMNVTFNLPSEELTDAFVAQAEKAGFDGLRGHRSVGGIRASIYNAFPHEGCVQLAQFMTDFAARNG